MLVQLSFFVCLANWLTHQILLLMSDLTKIITITCSTWREWMNGDISNSGNVYWDATYQLRQLTTRHGAALVTVGREGGGKGVDGLGRGRGGGWMISSRAFCRRIRTCCFRRRQSWPSGNRKVGVVLRIRKPTWRWLNLLLLQFPVTNHPVCFSHVPRSQPFVFLKSFSTHSYIF